MKSQAIINVNKAIYGYRMNRARLHGAEKMRFDYMLYVARRHKCFLLAAGR
jgi:hypothetical protein